MDHAIAYTPTEDAYLDDILAAILEPEDGQLIQVLYVQQADGVVRAFVGAPMSEKDLHQVQGIALGEIVAVELSDGSDDEFDGPRCTR
jgi:hypothetical protein